MSGRLFYLILIGGMLLAACDRPKAQKRLLSTTTVREGEGAAAAPMTQPATKPSYSSLWIAGKEYKFPPARLLLQQEQPTVDVLLFSNDPPDALAAGYTGNRFFFQLALNIDEIGKLAATDFQSKAASLARIDSPDGIFLEGEHKQLQPFEWRVTFSQTGRTLSIAIDGHFVIFGPRDELGPPRTVPVQGMLTAELEMPGRAKTP